MRRNPRILPGNPKLDPQWRAHVNPRQHTETPANPKPFPGVHSLAPTAVRHFIGDAPSVLWA
jgi:hypothetical protein